MATVDEHLAANWRPGDRVLVVERSGALLHVPAGDIAVVSAAVERAGDAVTALRRLDDAAVDRFFTEFADRLADDACFEEIAAANAADVDDARRRGRSTTRLVLSASMRASMVEGLRTWATMGSGRDELIRRVDHQGWSVELRRAPLGVVGFVFEGRPNVFADACGVVRSGNAAVFRIGSDALRTARSIVEHALAPALAAAGLPSGAVQLVDSASRAAGWALFSDTRLALAVARGSGDAVEQLGSVARQAGVPVSLHGTGGAWLVAGAGADPARLAAVVRHSLDRKVCNTLNVAVLLADRAAELMPVLLDSVRAAAAARDTSARLHVHPSAAGLLDPSLFGEMVTVQRAEGPVVEPFATELATEQLGTEWEWEGSPELSVVVAADLDAAIELCNRWSPRLVASLVSDDAGEQDRFWAQVDSPFAGDGFTRWVDGQFALDTPELGLSNWEHGRLLGRAGVLSGDSVFTVRARMRQVDPTLHR